MTDHGFTADLGRQVCDMAAQGHTLNRIAETIGYSRTTIWRWRCSNPLFERDLARALEEGAHAMVDETLAIADDVEANPNITRNRIHARQWAVERRYRKHYGASVDVQVTERVELGGTLLEARKRIVLPSCDPARITDAQVIDYVPARMLGATDTQSDAAPEAPYNPFD